MTPTLEPCPFCGGEADIDAPTKIERMVYCKGCYATICEDSTPDARAAWNRRAAPQDDTALLREAAEALEVNWAVVMNSANGDQQRLNRAITKLRERLGGA